MANSFFTIKDGKAVFNEETTRDPTMKLFSQYIEFIDKNASEEDRAYLFKLVMGGLFQGGKQMVDGEEQDIKYGPMPQGFLSRFIDLNKKWVDSLNISDDQKRRLEEALLKMENGEGNPEDFNAILAEIGSQASEATLPSIDYNIRDFRAASREKLIELIKDVEGDNPLEYHKWAQWDAVDDFTRALLFIDFYRNDINKYYEYLIEKNNTSIDQINKIFDTANEIDDTYKKFLNEKAEVLKGLGVQITELTGKFDTSAINVDLSNVKVN